MGKVHEDSAASRSLSLSGSGSNRPGELLSLSSLRGKEERGKWVGVWGSERASELGPERESGEGER